MLNHLVGGVLLVRFVLYISGEVADSCEEGGGTKSCLAGRTRPKFTIHFQKYFPKQNVPFFGGFWTTEVLAKPSSCEINDAKDAEEEKLVDHKPELYTGILLNVSTLLYVAYLKLNFSEVSCCATSHVLIFLPDLAGYNIRPKNVVFEIIRGQPGLSSI